MNIGGMSITDTLLPRCLTYLDRSRGSPNHKCTTSMHELASSVDDHIVSIEFNLSDARGKATIEGMNSISFGQSHAEEARRP